MQSTDVLQQENIKETFEAQGYIIIRDFFSSEEMESLIENIKTAKTRKGVSNLNRGALTFYSNVFFYSKEIQDILAHPKVVDLLSQIIGPNFWVRWDQAVAKGNGAGTFAWHQDNAYSRLKDPHYQLWIAMTEMTPDNGGLWLQPGSHKRHLPHKYVGNHVEFEGQPENPIFIEAKAGDVVVFSSLTLHSTTPNVTQKPRWAYVIEYMSSEHFDPGIEPPYFVVSKDGKPQPEFVHFYPGRLNPINHLKYLGFRWLPSRLKLKKAVESILPGKK